MRDRSTKMLAVLMISLMAVVAVAPLAGEETDAAVGDGGAYSYTLTYHADQMANTAAQETQLTVDGMTPISHASGTTTLTALANEGSWSWNTTTGIGPFNSFYAAFDMNDGNKPVAVLDPYDLTKTIDGTSLDSSTNYNVMWVLPTVYWSVDNNGAITLTNDANAGGTAYAHTINGHTYNYIALGVYEGSTKTVGGVTVLTSESGATPTASQTKTTFRDYANNYTMNETLGADSYSMLWNFYQWELYKYVCYTVMEGFNSQMIVGNGNVNGNNYSMANGLTDTLGPYAGNPGDIGSDSSNATLYGQNAVKLFIENPWGTVNDFVDGVIIFSNQSLYIDTSSIPNDDTTGEYVEQIAQSLPTSNFGATITTGEKIWGLAATTNSSTDYYNKGTTDKIYTETSGSRILSVGGDATSSTSAVISGLSCTVANNNTTASGNYIGARLAFVMDDYPQTSYSVSFDIDGEGYGSLSDSTTISVETGSEITISGTTGNVLKIGENTVTATPAAATSDYTYSFDGWFNESTQLETGDTVDDDMTITAKFSRAAILTVTLDAGKGTVSSSSLTVVEGQAIGDLPTPTPKAGYTFTGWFDSEGNEVTSETIVTETESFTLYAQYELDDSLKPVKAMTDLLPLIFVVGIIILMIGTAFYYYRP